jgi:hypothetical protein
MDLFEKINLFEKLATQISEQAEESVDDAQNAETINDYSMEHKARRTSIKGRLNKLGRLAKR